MNVIGLSWVINDLKIAPDGRVLFARTLIGDDPLRSLVLDKANRWQFEPAKSNTPVEAHATTIFLFRPRTIFSEGGLDLSLVPVIDRDRGPLPVRLTDPGYPANSIAEGVVVVELRLTETGAVQEVRPVSVIPGLMALTEQVVRSWKFKSAMSNGVPVPGTVVAAISYLRPSV
jgi:outer membrane biosynthesis protein TonB